VASTRHVNSLSREVKGSRRAGSEPDSSVPDHRDVSDANRPISRVWPGGGGFARFREIDVRWRLGILRM